MSDTEEVFKNADVQPKRPLAYVFADALRNHTWGSLNMDVKRAHVLEEAFEDQGPGNPWADTRFSNTGMRCKVMRHLSVGPEFKYQKFGKECVSQLFDFGIGASFEIDSARLRPKARVRVRNMVSLGLFPCPSIKIQKRLPVGKTGWSVRASYLCALSDIKTFYKPPARLIVMLDDDQNYGLRLSHSGIELARNTWLWGDDAHVQASALVHLPRTIPWDPSDKKIGCEWSLCGVD
eukprot:jgi/Picre1/35858/NNA_003318.t1